MWRWCLVGMLAGAAACTPAMNWRDTNVGRVTVLLPCKPDRGQRAVRLADQDVTLSMAGCEAGGALFAVSHIQVPGDRAQETATAWRKVTLANMRAGAATDVAGSGGSASLSMQRITTQGLRPDGSPVQAQLAWITSGGDVFQLAVYADRLTPDMLDNLFSDIKLQ